jgi:hypothetical protein
MNRRKKDTQSNHKRQKRTKRRMRLCWSRRNRREPTAVIVGNSSQICLLRNLLATNASANSVLVNLDTVCITNALLVSKKIKKTLLIKNSSKDKKKKREFRKK